MNEGTTSPPGLGRPRPPAVSFDLGELMAAPFRDPDAVRKFLFGSLAVLLIPVFGLGLFALFGFLVRTARGELRGEVDRVADWDDPGELLVDGLKAAGVVASWGLLVGLLALVTFGASLLLTAFFLLPATAGLLQLVATGRFGAAFDFSVMIARIREHPVPCLYLALTALLFSFLAAASLLLCLIGVFPGSYWGFAATGAAVGRAGRVMGLRDRSASA